AGQAPGCFERIRRGSYEITARPADPRNRSITARFFRCGASFRDFRLILPPIPGEDGTAAAFGGPITGNPSRRSARCSTKRNELDVKTFKRGSVEAARAPLDCASHAEPTTALQRFTALTLQRSNALTL